MRRSVPARLAPRLGGALACCGLLVGCAGQSASPASPAAAAGTPTNAGSAEAHPAAVDTVAPTEAPGPDAVPESGPAPEPAPAPAPAPKVASRVTPKMERRIRSKLRKTHGANVLLLRFVEVPLSDGGVAVLGIYEYSRLQACASAAGGTATARKTCVESAIEEGEWYEDFEESDYDCNRQGLVRATFGPPRPGKEAYGGAMTLDVDRALPEACRIARIDEFTLVDLDADGALELAVAYGTVTPNAVARGGGSFDASVYRRGWYREDLQPQAEVVTADWASDDWAMSYTSSTALEFVDLDKDGHIDIRATRHEVQMPGQSAMPSACLPAADGAAIDPDACDAALEEEGLPEELDTTVVQGRYDAKADQWRFDGPLR